MVINDLRGQMHGLSEQVRQLKDDAAAERQDRRDYERLSQDLNNKLKAARDECQNVKAEAAKKEFEWHDALEQAHVLEQEVRELRSKMKKSDLRMLQLQTTKVRDMQRDIRSKDETISDLKKKLQDIIHSPQLKRPYKVQGKSSVY